jgi:hypothetical protein
MRLNDILRMAFNGVGAKLRRDAICYALIAFCALGMIVFAASASVLALEPMVGMVYARLILAGFFAFALVATALTLWAMRRPASASGAQMHLHAQAQTAQRSAQFAQLAMIVEALLLGYSMARRR